MHDYPEVSSMLEVKSNETNRQLFGYSTHN